jgi:HPt (histidine-containing phosphotransfer) domain-containing protein
MRDSGEAIHSSLADDEDLGEIVDLFVAEMPDRIERLLGYAAASNWPELERLAHQLKGAAGSYGFEPVSPAAARVEAAVRDEWPEVQLRVALDDLVSLCQRMRAGLPESAHVSATIDG